MAIGVDIEDIERFKGKSQDFLNRVFTFHELEYCLKFSKPESHLAARFCAKEAVVKALTALDIDGVSYNEIEVFHNEKQCPQIRILKSLEKNIIFQLSLSHDRSKAIAFVTAEEQ
ncbi:MAG TPA: holo-ACP synthase [Candidatus Stercorousia faecigallinarum]|nr:holo-ACP synthase [Candidatus Stercorousia faecigallinarum]